MAKNNKDKPETSPEENQAKPEAQQSQEQTAAAPQEGGNFTLTAEEMAEIRKLYETLETQKKKIDEGQDQYLRLYAEYDNFRKRSAREREALYADIKADTLTALLPVYDNLERALRQPCTDEAYCKGVQMTMNQFDDILKKLGVEEIAALGQPFDPNLYHGVMHEENAEFGENVVSEVLQKGFKIGDKIIRFAMVKVAN